MMTASANDMIVASAVLETFSLVWMEVSMFAAAAMVYAFFVGGFQLQTLSRWLPRKGNVADMQTPKMHALAAAVAASRSQYDEVLRQLRCIPSLKEGLRCVLPGAAVSEILGLARHEGALATAVEELQRLGARPCSKALRRVIAEARAQGFCCRQELEDAANTLQGPKIASHGGHGAQRAAYAIRSCALDLNLASATDIFNRFVAGGEPPSTVLYNSFLDACVQCRETERATKHFEEMRRLDIADVVAYNTLLKMHLSSGQCAEARLLVQEMATRGVQASRVTYNELLQARVAVQDLNGAWRLIDEMHDAGVTANLVTCSILMKTLTVHSRPWDARRVIGLLDQVDEPLDEVLVSSIIDACIRAQQLELLSDFMCRYREKVWAVPLMAPTYGSMIKAYGQAGDIQRVKALWEEMMLRGVKPTSITLGCMTDALVTNGCTQEAWVMIHRLLEDEEMRACVNTVTYSTVLKGFSAQHAPERAFAVYKEMRAKGVACNAITYNTLLDACAKCSAMSRASGLLEDMKAANVEPDVITYSTLIKGYCLEGDLDLAFGILKEMRSDGKFLPDEITYNSLMDGCTKQHRVDDALGVLEEMKAAGVGLSNYTLSILVKILGHARRLNQAFNMVEELSKEHGFRPNVQVYTCLMQACIFNRRLERAIALHNTMVSDSACIVDKKLYTVMTRGCLQMGKPMKAVEVVRAAFQLQGHSLAEPARKPARPVGVEPAMLQEVLSRLRGGNEADRRELTKLEAELGNVCGPHASCSARTSNTWEDSSRRAKSQAGAVREGRRKPAKGPASR